MVSENTSASFIDHAWQNDTTHTAPVDLRAQKDIGIQDNYICTGEAWYYDNLFTDQVKCGIASGTGWEWYVYCQSYNVFGPTKPDGDSSTVTSWTALCDYSSGSNVIWRGYVNI